jgi:FixJ family two-component response regulator
MACEAMRRAAVEFLQKPVNPQQLLDRVQKALAKDSDRRRTAAERASLDTRVSSLTSRERDVVDLAVTGMTNKQIAAPLGVSSQAMDAHRSKALEKTQATNVPELVRLMLMAEAN